MVTTGGAAAALRSRSVLNVASKIKASALILNGELDDRTSPEQARLLADRINSNGGQARVIIYPAYGHQIPIGVRNSVIDPFIDNVIGK
jgi:dipeptidyl aminopeptidase/acylaminoacyl peptidase